MSKVYRFGSSVADGSKDMADLLGSKGANLAEMSKLGIDVPDGITLSTTSCNEYRELGPLDKTLYLDDLVDSSVIPALAKISNSIGYWPLWSVRSGASDSMPGMMDTLLNVGLTTGNFEFWDTRIGKLARLDCRRRQVQMYGTTVEGIPAQKFTKEWGGLLKYKYNLKSAPANEAEMLGSLSHMQKARAKFEKAYLKATAGNFPDSLREQLIGSIRAVLDSWDSERAVEYREMHGIDHNAGTAVNIQMMVFGNLNEKSCSGVAFTRDPATGESVLMGEFLTTAQGEDVVAGTATPESIESMDNWNSGLYEELEMYAKELETHYKDMMDLEFTVEDGKLWMLQCRVGKRSAKAAFRIAHDMAEEELITKAEAISRVTAKQYMALKKVRVSGDIPEPDFQGIAAGGGLVTGHVVTTAAEAKEKGKHSPVILVTDETTPNDFGGMAASVGILTRTGGATSHAAVVGRSLEKSCVVGCIDLPEFIMGENEVITIDGATGRVWKQELPLSDGGVCEYAIKVVAWGMDNNKDLLIKTTPAEPLRNKSYIMACATDHKTFDAFMDKADGSDFTEMFIDMRLEGEGKRPEDGQLWRLLGDETTDLHSGAIDEAFWATLSGDYTDSFKERVVIVPSAYMTDGQLEFLTNNNWRVVQRIKSLADLLDSDGIVDFDDAAIDAIGGQEIADKIFALMHDAGKTLRKVPVAVSQTRLVFEALK